MTSIATTPRAFNPDIATGAAQFLTPVVLDLIALSVNGKQAHWHVRGPGFIAVHELLDDVVKHARRFSDIAAERVIALGLPLDARLQTAAAKTTTPKMTPGFQQVAKVVEQMVAQIDATLETVQKAVDELAELDPASQDVAIEISRGLTIDRWYLAAHVEK
jgi:starvation-inducible DNA-binding protein